MAYGPELAGASSGVPRIETLLHAGVLRFVEKQLAGVHLNFIEQIFGISPDGGSGTLEVLFFAIPVIGLCILYWFRSLRNKRTS
jgi:hypothetical protein